MLKYVPTPKLNKVDGVDLGDPRNWMKISGPVMDLWWKIVSPSLVATNNPFKYWRALNAESALEHHKMWMIAQLCLTDVIYCSNTSAATRTKPTWRHVAKENGGAIWPRECFVEVEST